MPDATLHQLFDLPTEVKTPHAYQVFGLSPGEQDSGVIDAAIAKRIAGLKQARASTTPEVWQQSVALVQSAKATLKDASLKAELDARFGIFAAAEPTTPVVDPLAGLLPALPAAASPASSSIVSPPPTPTTPPVTAAPPPAIPVVRVKRPVRRRRGSYVGCFLGTLLIGALASLVGGLVYFAMFGPGKIEIVQGDGQFTIRRGDREPMAEATPPVAASPRPPKKPVSDGVLNPPQESDPESRVSLDGEMRPIDPSRGEMPKMPSGDRMTAATVEPSPSANEPNMPAESPPPTTPEPAPTETMPPPADATVPEPAVAEPVKPEPTPELIAEAERTIAAARQTILQADFSAMKSHAEKAQAAALTPAQQQAADTLYEMADLASYYDEAIGRAMAGLKANQEFMVNGTTPVLVRTATPDSITVYFSKRDFTMTRRDMKMSVAHALAPFELDIDSPTGQAAKAAYQAIAPEATPEHRSEAITLLRNLSEVEGADPKRVAELIATFPKK